MINAVKYSEIRHYLIPMSMISVQQYDSGVLFPKLKHSYPQRYEESFALDIGVFVDVLLYGKD